MASQAHLLRLLKDRGIQPSAHRIAVAEYALMTDEHPSADQVRARVKRSFPMISRATVSNPHNLFVAKGLLQPLVLAEGKVVFDPKVDRHHHFIDEDTGNIHDVPWNMLEVKNIQGLRGFDVREYQVVLRGRRAKAPRHT